MALLYISPMELMRNYLWRLQAAERRMTFGKKFYSTRRGLIGEYRDLPSRIRIGHEPFLQPMKTLLTVSLCSLTFALNSFGQTSPPPPASGSPAISAPTRRRPAGDRYDEPALAPSRAGDESCRYARNRSSDEPWEHARVVAS